MASDTSTATYRVATSEASRASVLRVWDIVNTHFQSLLTTAERSDTKSRAESNIRTQVKELRDLMGACSRRLKTIEVYISELQKREAGASTDDCSTLHTPSSELAGEWHFLYKADTSVFGYMQLVPETVAVTSCGRHGEGTNPVKRAEFTLPSGVLSEADVDDSDVGYTQLDGWCDRSLCPCCQVSFKASEFWKHALFEISDRGNRVPAWQSLDRFEVPRWIVDERACQPRQPFPTQSF
ncbi:hypothetical protein DPEC_G00364220 [Dallia pectoralis]|nr:hypothetical protein DPEC_G00364220 [Dallia pectoralis]